MKKKFLTYTAYLYLVSYAFVVTSFGLFNKPIADSFHAGERAMGLLISTHFAGYIVMTIYGGFLADRIGLKPVLTGSVALMGVALIGFANAWSLHVLFVMMLFTGFAGGAIEASVNAVISRLYSDSRVYAINMLHLFFGVGAFSWPVIGGQLLHGGIGWRQLMIILGVFSLIMAGLMSVQEFPSKDATASIRLTEMIDLLKQPVMIFLGLLMALYVGTEIGINTWIVRYFEDELLHGNKIAATLHMANYAWPLTTGIYLTLYWFSMTVGRLIVTIIGRRVTDYKLLRVVTTCSAATALATFLVRGPGAATIFLALTGFFFAGIFATSVAIGNNRFPQYAGSVSGLVIGLSGIGNVVINTGIGAVAQHTGSIRDGMLFAAVLLIGMAACSFAIKKDRKVIAT